MKLNKFNLWNEEWECKESKAIIYEIFLSNQIAMKQFVKGLYETQSKSCVFKKTGNSYHMTISVNPWIYENFNTMKNMCSFVTRDRITGIFESHDVKLNLNWSEINNSWFSKALEIEKIFGEFTSNVFANSAQNYVNNFRQLYENELDNSQGLGFGIISSSIASHLIYASMSVKNDMKNHARASLNAREIAGEPSEAVSMDLAERGGRFYNDYIQDMIVNLVTDYFVYVEEVITKGFGEDWDELSALWNKYSYKAIDYSSREEALEALKVNPINIGALVYALYYWGNDERLIAFCKRNSSIVVDAIHDEMIQFCIDVNTKSNRRIYNKLIIDDDNSLYWNNLKNAYKKIYIESYSEKWENLIHSVYYSEVCTVQDYLRALKNWKKKEEVEKYFKNVDIVNKAKQYYVEFMTSNDFKTLAILYNKLEMQSVIDGIHALYQTDVLTENNFKEYMAEMFKNISDSLEYRINVEKEYHELIETIDSEKEELSKLWYALFGSAARRKKELEEKIRIDEAKKDELINKNNFLMRKLYWNE